MGLKEPVQVLLFGSKENCDYCSETQQLLEEVTALSEKMELSFYDVNEDQEIASRFNVTNAPGIIIAAKENAEVVNLGIQFSGIPSGHEFSTLINDILMVSKRDSGLDVKTREFLKNLEKPLSLAGFCHAHLPILPAGGIAGSSNGNGKSRDDPR